MTVATQIGEFALSAVFGLLLAFAVHSFGMKKGRCSAVIECAVFVIGAVAFVFLGVFAGFSDRRAYHYLGILTGIILYLKTFGIIVAFFKKVCYNTITKLRDFVCKKRKKLAKDRSKTYDGK